jgi:hypothetical protein
MNRAFAERISTMIRTPQYKLIRDARKAQRDGGEYELYDLTNDPLEANNVASDPGHAAVLKELADQLEAWQKDNPPTPAMTGVTPEPPVGIPANLDDTRRSKRTKRRAVSGATDAQPKPD